jgi:hypothetical protein
MKRKTKTELEHELMQVLCRLAILRDDALRCAFSDCRRARVCMGTDHFTCVFKPHDPERPMHHRDVRTWNELARQREALHEAIRRCR